jgi:hypothetical protein
LIFFSLLVNSNFPSEVGDILVQNHLVNLHFRQHLLYPTAAWMPSFSGAAFECPINCATVLAMSLTVKKTFYTSPSI